MSTDPRDGIRTPQPKRWPGPTPVEWTIIILLIGMGWAILAPAVQHSRGGSVGPICKNNLKQIGLALHNYHDTYGCFPPAYIADQDGRPMHSWRVLLLPSLDQAHLYRRYRFDEPWDGPHNRELHGEKCKTFNCPEAHRRDQDSDPLITNFVAVVGAKTLWPGADSMRLDQVGDGADKTIAVVEMLESGIHWMDPRDLDWYWMAGTINHPSRPGISSVHKESAHFLFVDGSVKHLPETTKASQLRALLTPNGREKVTVLD